MSLDSINDRFKQILDKDVTDFRKELNKSVHFVDLSFGTLYVNAFRKEKRNLSLEQFKSIYFRFMEAVADVCGRVYQDIEYIPQGKITKTFLLYYNNEPILISPSFNAAQAILSKASKRRGIKNSILGATKKTFQKQDKLGNITSVSKLITNVDLGHIAGEESGFTTPGFEKVEEFLDLAQISNNTTLIESLQQVRDKFIDLPYFLNTYSEITNNLPEVFKKLKTSGVLLEFAVYTTVHTTDRNRNILSSLEKSLVKEASTIVEKLTKVPGSNTFMEDIEQGLIQVIKGIKPSLKQHTKRKSKVLKGSKETIKKSISSPTLRTKQGQFTSLTSLQNLLNSRLAEQIKRNMGKGFSKSVLNNRTGRFASSAQVQRMTISKQGMITAFYSYMKSPYQTFEPGFAQGSPQSRDPKLLISKSIREIAAASMANRLRAVSI